MLKKLTQDEKNLRKSNRIWWPDISYDQAKPNIRNHLDNIHNEDTRKYIVVFRTSLREFLLIEDNKTQLT